MPKAAPLHELTVDSLRLEVQIRHLPEQEQGFNNLNCVLHLKLTNGFSDTVYLLGYAGPHFWGGLVYDTGLLFIPGYEHLRKEYFSIDTLLPHRSAKASLISRIANHHSNIRLAMRLRRIVPDAYCSDSNIRAFIKHDTGVLISAVSANTTSQ